MINDNNISLRSEILERSLSIEFGVNNLLLSHLSIFDKSRTKNFGNKAGISFKSKIDLLYDINVLSKEEHFNLELQMVFRNKFLHDIEFNSFLYAIKNMDKGIVKHLEKKDRINYTESYYKNAYYEICNNNINVISVKFKERREEMLKKKDFIVGITKSYEQSLDLSLELVQDIFYTIESFKPQTKEDTKLLSNIFNRCRTFINITEEKSLVTNMLISSNTNSSDILSLLK